ncbi:hypothetical protein WJT74_08125 [Sphingomicrobium sp. XHP0239]|uniref:hypothetical protein n=1 Tax=Sphingomicrobium maritimum TaxID=3133972 RepID=UPI0031CC9473
MPILARVNAIAGVAALGILLSGCDGTEPTRESDAERAIELAQGPEGERARPGGEAATDCLEDIWAVREQADDYGGQSERDFDRANDAAEGGAISCATATSATQFVRTIEALRDSASNRDRAAVLERAGIPLLFINSAGEREEIRDRASLEAAFDRIFTDRTLDRMQNLELEDLTVVPDKGAFFDLGAIWLVVPETGAEPKLVTLNDQASAEMEAIAAAETAKNEQRATR